jgi:hypothetical protein
MSKIHSVERKDKEAIRRVSHPAISNDVRQETASKIYYLGERAIVVGGGLAGLSARSCVLSDRFGPFSEAKPVRRRYAACIC